VRAPPLLIGPHRIDDASGAAAGAKADPTRIDPKPPLAEVPPISQPGVWGLRPPGVPTAARAGTRSPSKR
jgi:hypothetical protein